MKGTEATSKRSTAPVRRTAEQRALALRALAPPALLLVAALLWLDSLRKIDPGRMDDFGLVSVLPVSFVLALLLVSLSFALTVATCVGWRRYCRALVTFEIVLLVLILYGTPALVEVVPRSATTWQHLGVADYIARTEPSTRRSTRISTGPGSSSRWHSYNVSPDSRALPASERGARCSSI